MPQIACLDSGLLFPKNPLRYWFKFTPASDQSGKQKTAAMTIMSKPQDSELLTDFYGRHIEPTAGFGPQ
jgi:hypothetical protein